MKKSFWMNLIIFIAVFMITLDGILPTNVVFATDSSSSQYTDGIERADDDSDDASIFERIICGLFVLIGSGLYALVQLVAGEPLSIDRIIFNGYSNTKLSFFESDVQQYGANKFLESANIRPILNGFFETFRGIAVLAYLIILVYMGIRIILGSTAEKGSRYKELMVYWLQGIIILFVFPFIMKYAIHINNAFVSFVGENRNRFIVTELNGGAVSDSEMDDLSQSNGMNGFESLVDKVTDGLLAKKDTDYMAYMYAMAVERGWIVYIVCWFIMFFQMVGFLVVYFKRVLVVMFLIAIFPLVMISYAIDKIGDGKSQAFDNWVKEYLSNIFVQSFHAIAYVLIMSIVSCLGSNPSEYWLVMLIALSFISKGDDILRAIFSLGGSQGTVKGIGASLGQVAVANTIATGIRNVGAATVGENGFIRKIGGKAQKVSDVKWKQRANRAEREAMQMALNKIPETSSAPAIVANGDKTQIVDDIKNAADVALGKKAATDQEFQNALDKLTKYRNLTGNKDVQDALDSMAQGLTGDEANKLEELLKQNAMINSLITRGTDINFSQNVSLVLAALKRDKNGNLTPESKKMLKKLAISEDELKEMASYSEIKFKEDKSQRVQSENTRVSNNEYWTGRRGMGGARGRTAARRNRENNNLSDAKTIFEATRNRNMSQNIGGIKIAMTETEKRKLMELKRRKKNAQSAMDKVVRETRKQEVSDNNANSNGTTTGSVAGSVIVNKTAIPTGKKMTVKRTLNGVSKFTVKQPNDASSTIGSTTTKSFAKTISEKNTANAKEKARKNAEVKKAIDKAQSSSKASNKGYAQRKKDLLEGKGTNDSKANNKIGFDASNDGQQGPIISETSRQKQNLGPIVYNENVASADKLQEIINNFDVISGGTVSNLSNSDRVMREKKVVDMDVEMLKDSVGVVKDMTSGKHSIDEIIMEAETIKKLAEEYKDEKSIGHKDVTQAIKDANCDINKLQDDMLRLKEITEMKKSAGSGEYTARELLANAKELENLVDKYRNGTDEEKKFAKIMEDYAGCSPESYEMMLRVKILNNPDSVNSDSAIIEECKKYLKENTMSDFIRSRLNYNVNDLREGVNVKYLNSNENDDSQITSSAEQQKYREAIERSKYEEKINKLDNEYADLKKEKNKEVRGTVVTAIDSAVHAVASTFGGAAIGGVVLGMSNDSKKDVVANFPEKVLGSYAIGSELAGGTVQGAIDIRDKAAKRVADFIKEKRKKPSTASESTPEFEAESTRNYRQRLADLADKTRLEGESFAERRARMSNNSTSNM